MPLALDHALIRVSGPDAVGFLDNLLTQDVTRLAAAGVQYAALLSPQGKVLADMLLWADGDGVLIEAARGPELLRRLNMYKLRAQVTLEDVTPTRMALHAQESFDGARPDPRRAELGWRAVAPRTDAAAGDDAYYARRLTLGVPDLARDAGSEEVFALEALLEELNGVDFKKGCFVGQENVSRMKRRATTRKKFCPITFTGDAPPFGAALMASAAELGSVRGGANGRALALLRLDRALEAAARGETLSVDGRQVQLDPPPWLILPQSGAQD